MKEPTVTDIEILRVLVDEHEANMRRDLSYAALNSDLLDEGAEKVENVIFVFIQRLICDDVISRVRLLKLIAAQFAGY